MLSNTGVERDIFYNTGDERDRFYNMSRLVGIPTMWFPTRSDTNWPVQSQKRARILKLRI